MPTPMERYMSLLPVNNPGMSGMLGYAQGQQQRPQQAPRQQNYGPQNDILRAHLARSMAPQRETSMLDRMLGLYGADPNSHIPEGRQDEARRLGMQLGVQNVQQGQNLSSMQGLTRFLQGMQQAGPVMGAMDQKRAMQERMMAMAQSGQISKQDLQAMLIQSLATGDNESARTLAEVIKSMGDAGGDFNTLPPGAQAYDSAGNLLAENDNSAGNKLRTRAGLVHPEGLPGKYEVDILPDGTEDWPNARKMFTTPPGSGNPSELERRAAFFVPLADTAEEKIRAFTEGLGAPGRLQQLLEKTAINELQGPEAQEMYTAGRQLGDAYLRLTSGAAIRPEEIDMFIRSFLPYPGDGAEVLALKRIQRQAVLSGLRNVGHRALAQHGTGSQPTEDGGGLDTTVPSDNPFVEIMQ